MSTITDPERLDRDSPSSAYRRRRCVGSANLIRALRKAGKLPLELPDPDAAFGIRVHQVWCGDKVEPPLNRLEGELVASLERLERLVVTDWAGRDQYTLLGREQRLWLHEHLEPVHSGQFDVAYGTVETGRILILDGKTGFKPVLPAEQNDQLSELVGLGRANFSRAVEFSVAVLAPNVQQRVSVARYDQIEAELALRQLRATIRDSADPDAPRVAGVWCEHCPARAVCVEARLHSSHTYELAKKIANGELELPLGKPGARLLEAVAVALKLLETIKKTYKAVLANQPDAVDGWYLKEGHKVRAISDALGAYGIAKEFMEEGAFFDATKVSVTALQALCAGPSGFKGKALTEFFNERFASVIKVEQNEPELAQR